MRTVQELTAELEILASDFNLMLDTVRAEDDIGMERAALGKEYAEVYRAKLLVLKREAAQSLKSLRIELRNRVRSQSIPAPGLDNLEALEEIRDEALFALQPLQDLIFRLDQLIMDAALVREAFANEMARLRAQPQEAEQAAEAEVDIAARESQRVEELLAELNDALTKWKLLSEEAERRLEAQPNPEIASHLRGIKETFDTAVDDLSAILTAEELSVPVEQDTAVGYISEEADLADSKTHLEALELEMHEAIDETAIDVLEMEIESEINDLELELMSELEAEVEAERQAEVTALEEEIAEIEAEIEAEIDDLQAEIIDELAMEVEAELQAEMVALEEEIAEIEAEIDAEIDDLQAEIIEAIDSQIEVELNDRLITLEEEIAEVESEIAAPEEQLAQELEDQIEADLAQQLAEIDALEQEIAAAELEALEQAAEDLQMDDDFENDSDDTETALETDLIEMYVEDAMDGDDDEEDDELDLSNYAGYNP